MTSSSKIIPSVHQRAALRDQKGELNSDLIDAVAAGNMGLAARLGKQVAQIQADLDDDAAARKERGWDECQARGWDHAAPLHGNHSAGAGVDREQLRALCTPGSAVTDLWVKPQVEQAMAPASSFTRQAHSYLTTDTATIGSAYYFTPELFREVVTGLLDASGVLEANPTIITTDHLRDIQVPVLTADAVATAGTEGSAATDANTEGDVVTLGAYRYDGVFSVSAEMLMSSEYDLETLLSTFAVRAIANKTAAMLALGNGTTQPAGLFTSAVVPVGVTAASSTAVTVDEVLQLTKALGKGYRKQAKLVVSDVLHTALLQEKDDNGQYLMRSVETGGYEFAGRPVIMEPWADQSGMSAAETHAVYGDFTAGYIVRVSPMFFRRSDADPLNPQFTFACWIDGKIVDDNALKSLVLKA